MSASDTPFRLAGTRPDGAPFDLLVDGARVTAYPGETIATAMIAAGRRTLRRSVRRDEPRGLACVMGVCWECVVFVDGRSVRACRELAAPGMHVATAAPGSASVAPGRDTAEAADASPAPRAAADRREPTVLVTDLAIVGAGPAGLAAAAEAAMRGVSVVVLDEDPDPGGQYFRQAPAALARASGLRDGPDQRRASALFAGLQHPRVTYLRGAAVWDVPEPGVLAFVRGAHSGRVRASCVLIAAGAVERAVPFPGWTLPGVLTAGGLQNLVKGQRVLPGRRFLVAGNGPLLLVSAHSIVKEGGIVVAVVEAAAPLAGALRHLPWLLAAPAVLRRGIGYRAVLRRAGVPLWSGHTIVEALGEDHVRGAVVAPIDAAGRVDRARARAVAVDTIVAGFGLVPSTELTRLAGCRHRWDAGRGGVVPDRSADLETTTSGVFVAGDGGGIGGVELALTEGRLAGLLIAHRLGRANGPDVAVQLRRLRARARRLERARLAIATIWTPPAGYLALLRPDTIVCRCEEVTADEIDRQLEGEASSVDAVKVATRVTMGRCQGRNCLATVLDLAARAWGVAPADVRAPRMRPPARPIRLEHLLHEPLPDPRPPELRLS